VAEENAKTRRDGQTALTQTDVLEIDTQILAFHSGHFRVFQSRVFQCQFSAVSRFLLVCFCVSRPGSITKQLYVWMLGPYISQAYTSISQFMCQNGNREKHLSLAYIGR